MTAHFQPPKSHEADRTARRLRTLNAQLAAYRLFNPMGTGMTPFVAERMNRLQADLESELSEPREARRTG